jgi:methionine-rich copper-binding protein CopC
VSQTVDISETFADSEISVYPNPTKGTFQVVVNEGKDFSKLKLFNNVGQLVHEQDIDRNTKVVEITPEEEWNAGIYSLEVSGLGEKVTKKVVLF